MDIKTKEIYSEVYSVLNMLGDSYITKLPSSLYKMIKEEKLKEYNPDYDSNIALEQQNIRKESISMIALFHLNYWCNSEEEKNELKTLFKANEEKYQAEIREKYNPDDIFKNKKQNYIEETKHTEENTSMIAVQEEKWYKKIFNLIKNLFKKVK